MRPLTTSLPARRLVASLTGGLLLAGCSVSLGGADALGPDELVQQLDPQLQDLKGEGAEVDDLNCDGDLAADVDAEQRCHFTDVNGDRYGLTVTVTDVDGGDVAFDLATDPGQTLEPAELEPELVTQLTTLSGGVAPDDVSCPGDLPGVVGETITCVLTAGPDRLETYVTVTSAEGPAVGFDIEVADEALP
ncbi:hypothetical protein BH09ACT12_BH09ACT12_17950 [soil metagenome]